ncbi:MAG: hypothetical protein U0228_13175 [Myxococcaceae bacterium]
MAQRRSNDDHSLRLRVTELEARVRWLERRLKKVAQAAKVKAEPAKQSTRPRCPGCLAELNPRRKDRHCPWCGFSFEAVRPLRPSRARR